MSINKEKTLRNITISFLIGILILAALVCPKNDYFEINSNTRALYIAISLTFFGIIQLFRPKTKINIYSVDIWWIILIAYTGLSALWSLNDFYAIYGMFTTMILYLCYKAFESIEWKGVNGDILYWVFFGCLVLAIGLEVYCVRSVLFSEYFDLSIKRLDTKFLAQNFDKNLHLLGGLIVVLFPFVLFDKSKFSKVISPILLIIALISIYASDSAMVILVLILLIIIYALFLLKISLRRKTQIIMIGVFFIGIFFLFKGKVNLRSKSFVVSEFYSQNDRLLMWENSWKLFKESPLVGHGKNNWELSVGKYGYEYSRGKIKYFDSNRFAHAHNSFFQILSEQGIIGLLIYLMLIILPVVSIFYQKDKISPLQLSGIVCVLTFFILTNIYGSTYNFFENFRGISIIAILGYSLMQNKNSKIYISSNVIPKIIFMGAILGCIFFFSKVLHSKNAIKESRYLIRKKQYDKAEKNLKTALNFYAESDVFLELGKQYIQQKRWSDASNVFMNALDKDAYNPELLYQYANTLFQQEEFKKARFFSKKCFDLYPTYLSNKILLAKCQYQLNNSGQAKKIFKKVMDFLNIQETMFNNLKKIKGGFKNPKIQSNYRKFLKLQKDINEFIKTNNIKI